MNKRILWIVAVTVTAFAMSLNTYAQPGGGQGRGPGGPPGGGMGGPGGGMMGGGVGMVLQNPEFAKMLELTSDQTTRLQNVMRELGEERRVAMQQGGAPPSPEQMRQRMEQFMDSAQAKFDQVLNAQQRTKAREVMFQVSGGLTSPMVSDRMLQVLELTDAQKEQVRKITNARFEENRTAMQGGFDFRNASQEEREKFRADMEARNKKFADQITALLTPEQKAKAEKLTADAPALREKLGLPEPGQGGGQRQRPQGGGGQGPAGGYVPGAGAWQPGQPPPTRGEGGERPRNFPRPRERQQEN